MKHVWLMRGAVVLGLALPAWAWGYPLDGYEDTGIRRVEGSRRGHEGLAPGGFQPPGAQLSTEQVDLRLLAHRQLELPLPDSGFTAEIVALLSGADDASPTGTPEFREHMDVVQSADLVIPMRCTPLLQKVRSTRQP